MNIKVPRFIIRLFISEADIKDLENRTSLTGWASKSHSWPLFGLIRLEMQALLDKRKKPKEPEDPD